MNIHTPINVIFVCYGNICRSPLAEFLFKALTAGENVTVSSAATSDEEEGNPVYYAVRPLIEKRGIDCSFFTAHRLTKRECDAADYIIGMETSNVNAIKRICGKENENKVFRLLDFTGDGKDIADPWYTRDFPKAEREIERGLNSFHGYLSAKGELK